MCGTRSINSIIRVEIEENFIKYHQVQTRTKVLLIKKTDKVYFDSLK